MKHPIIYLERLADQEALFRAIWRRDNTYSGERTFDGAWDTWKRDTLGSDGVSAYPCLYSTNAYISAFGYKWAEYQSRTVRDHYLTTNSIQHFVEVLRRIGSNTHHV